MGKLGVQGKIWLSIAIFGAGYFAMLLLSQWTASQTQAHMKTASGSLFPAALSSQEAEAAFQKVSKRYNDAVLLQDKKVLASADQEGDALLAALQSVKEKTAFSLELQKQVVSITERFTDIRTRSKSVYSAMIDNPENISEKTQSAISALAQDNKQMQSSLQELRQRLSKDFESELAIVTTWSQRQGTFGFILFVVVVGCGTTMSGFVIKRQISNPLRELAIHLKDIAQGEGDLTRRLDVTSEDEIGEVAKWFNTFMEKLQRVIANVGVNTNGVATSSERLNAVSQTLSANAEETSSQANQVTTAAEQVSRNLQTVATGTGQMSDSIREIAKNATEAAKVAREAVNVAEATNSSISKLGVSSAEIGHVIKIITSIAQQTNLLALNATIEAARAGEAGKGFAVVANEVKELAKQTAAATEDISHKIEAIQGGTKGAVDAIASISSIINQINEIAGTIATAVELQNATTGDISRNLAEAARVSETITQNISGVAEAAHSTSRGVTDSQKTVEELAKMSSELHELVGQFKY